MEKKEMMNPDAYEKLLKERDLANMHYVGECINELYYTLEDGEIDIPLDIDDKIIMFCREKDKECTRKNIQKTVYTVFRRCAIFLICGGIIGGISISSVDAWKLRFTEFFLSQGDDYIEISPTDSELLKDWSNYYFFEEIPYGYEIVYAEERGNNKQIYFQGTDGKGLIILQQYDASANYNIDSETTAYEKITVKGKDVFVYEYEDGTMMAFWMDGGCTVQITIESEEKNTSNEIVRLAESVIFIK